VTDCQRGRGALEKLQGVTAFEFGDWVEKASLYIADLEGMAAIEAGEAYWIAVGACGET
jgi:hypothetical protein